MSRTRVTGTQVQGEAFATLKEDLVDVKKRTGYIKGQVNTPQELVGFPADIDDQVFVKSENKIKRKTSSGWVDVSGSVDEASVFIRCTSTTRPLNPPTGQHIYETDTRKTLVNNGTPDVPKWEPLASGSGGGGTDPEVIKDIEERVEALENGSPKVTKVFDEDFKKGNQYIDTGNTDAIVGHGYVRTDKIASITDNLSTDTNIATLTNAEVDTTKREIRVLDTTKQAMITTKGVPTAGTSFATIDASFNLPSQLGFDMANRETLLSNFQNTNAVTKTIVDNANRLWVIIGVGVKIYVAIYNPDGTQAYLTNITVANSRSILPASMSAIIDNNGRCWLAYRATANSSDYTDIEVINPIGTRYTSISVRSEVSYQQSGSDLTIDKDGNVWIAFLTNGNREVYKYNSFGTLISSKRTTYSNGSTVYSNVFFVPSSSTDEVCMVWVVRGTGRIIKERVSLDLSTVTTDIDQAFSFAYNMSGYVDIDENRLHLIYVHSTGQYTFQSLTLDTLSVVVPMVELGFGPNMANNYQHASEISKLPSGELLMTYLYKIPEVSPFVASYACIATDGTVVIPGTPIYQLNLVNSSYKVSPISVVWNGEAHLIYDFPGISAIEINKSKFALVSSSITVALSNNGGANWYVTQPGQRLDFPTTGNNLMIRFIINSVSNVSPKIFGYSVVEGNATSNTDVSATFVSAALPSTELVSRVTLTTVQQLNGNAIEWYVSNNGGATWVVAVPGVETRFNAPGIDLRVKAVLRFFYASVLPPIVNSYRVLSASAAISVSPDVDKRLGLLEANLSTVRQTFNEDFIHEVRVDRTKTTATVGPGYVRTEKLTLFEEDFSTTNNLNLTDSFNVTVDNTTKKVTINQGELEGQLVTKGLPTSGTQRATVDAQMVTPSGMAFGDKAPFVPWGADTTMVYNMRVMLDRANRRWEAYVSGFTGTSVNSKLYYRCINPDGSIAFADETAPFEMRDIGTNSVRMDNFGNIKMLADYNNNVWIFVASYAATNTIMQPRIYAISPAGVRYAELTKPTNSAAVFGDFILDSNNRIWYGYGTAGSTSADATAIYNSDGTVFLNGLLGNTAWQGALDSITMAEDTKRGRIGLYSWIATNIGSNICAIDYNGNAVFRGDARFGQSGSGQMAANIPASQISRALNVKMVYDEMLDKFFLIGTFIDSSAVTKLGIVQWNPETMLTESYAVYPLPNIVQTTMDFITENGITYFAFKSGTHSTTYSNVSFAAIKHSDKSLAISETMVTKDLDGYNHFVKLFKNRDGNYEIYAQKSAGGPGVQSPGRTFYKYTYLNRPTSILFELSNDDGITWHQADSGVEVVFPAVGNMLKLRAKLRSPMSSTWMTPELKFMSITESGGTGGYTRELYTTKLPTPQPATQIQLTATQELYDGSIGWYISNNGGATWHSILLGEDFSFSQPGSDVRLRAVFDVPSSAARGPILRSYTLQASSLTSAQAVDDLRTQLIQTNFRLIAMQAAARYNMKNMMIDNFTDLTGIDSSKSTPFAHTGGSLRIGEANIALAGYGGTASHPELFDGNLATYVPSNTTNISRTFSQGELVMAYEFELQQQTSSQSFRFRPTINGIAGSIIESGTLPGNQPAIFRVTLPTEQNITSISFTGITVLSGVCNIAEFRVLKRVGGATIVTTPIETVTPPRQALLIADETFYDAGATITYYLSRDDGATWIKAEQGVNVDLSAQSADKFRVKIEINGNAGVNALGVTWS